MTASPALVEFLTTTRIGGKGQLTVPRQFRKDLGLGTGAHFAVLRLGDGIILLPEQKRFDGLAKQISALLSAAGATPEAVRATLPQTRKRLYAQRCGATLARPPRTGGKARERRGQ